MFDFGFPFPFDTTPREVKELPSFIVLGAIEAMRENKAGLHRIGKVNAMSKALNITSKSAYYIVDNAWQVKCELGGAK